MWYLLYFIIYKYYFFHSQLYFLLEVKKYINLGINSFMSEIFLYKTWNEMS